MRFSYGNISLSYVNENMYLLGNMPFFKIHVNIFMAIIILWPEMIPLVDDSIPFEMILCQNVYCRRGAWCNFRSLEVFPLSDSVQFSRSVVSDSLRPNETQHARPPCPSPTPRVHPSPCPLSRWCHPTISSSVVPFSCPQSFPASGSLPMSQLFTSGGQSIGVQFQHQFFQWTPRTDLL